MRRFAGVAVVLALGAAANAHAAEKMAVLVLGSTEREAELADNVTEVVIAAVVRRGGAEVAGDVEVDHPV